MRIVIGAAQSDRLQSFRSRSKLHSEQRDMPPPQHSQTELRSSSNTTEAFAAVLFDLIVARILLPRLRIDLARPAPAQCDGRRACILLQCYSRGPCNRL